MEKKREWSREELSNGIDVYRGILTNVGLLETVYLGPGGAFVQMQTPDDPASVYNFLRDLLQCAKMGLYLQPDGLYVPEEDGFNEPIPEEYFQELAFSFVDGSDSRRIYTQEGLKRVGERLVRADANARGFYLDEEGHLYIRHGTAFRAASSHDPDTVFYTTLFGGALGLHRFLIGKFITGFLYLITGGLFLAGWAMDLIFLYLGGMKDKHKKVIAPPSHRLRKLFIIPLGFLVSVFVFSLIGSVFYALTSSTATFAPNDATFDFLQNAQSILTALDLESSAFPSRFTYPFQN